MTLHLTIASYFVFLSSLRFIVSEAGVGPNSAQQ